MKRVITVLVIALCAMLSSLAAQQATGPAPVAGATVAPASSSSTAGPRLQPEFRRYEPSVADSGTSSLMSSGGSHTIVLSTLALILVVIIVVLLVVK